jgi:glucose-6-phosphate isomerase
MKFIPDYRIAEHCIHLSEQFGFLLQQAANGMPKYKGATGWMDPYAYASESSLGRIERKANEIRAESDIYVIIGVGGSNNAARSIIEASDKIAGTPRILYAGTSTSPSAIERIIDEIEGKSVHINVIAKNFQTLEPGASFRILRKLLYERYGSDAAHRICATGTPGSKLEQLSKQNGWNFFLFPEDIGGRFSMFSDVALLPLAVAGINVRNYLAGAAKQRSLCLSLRPEENPCLLYAAARHELSSRGSKAEVLSIFEPRLQFFLSWWIQLFGESEGKNGDGLLPTGCLFSEELHSMGQFLQDGNTAVFETFLNTMENSQGPSLDGDGMDDGFDYLNGKTFSHLNSVARRAAESAHAKHIPCNVLSTGKPDEETFGEMFMFFALACVFSCEMKKVNPFDQPGVEEYKAMMFAELKKE